MGEVQLLVEAFTVECFVKSKVEMGVNLLERWGWMPQFLKYWTAVNIMKQSIILIGRVGKSTIVSKDIIDLASTLTLCSHTDWCADRGWYW
jgi:hypothetical protein